MLNDKSMIQFLANLSKQLQKLLNKVSGKKIVRKKKIKIPDELEPGQLTQLVTLKKRKPRKKK